MDVVHESVSYSRDNGGTNHVVYFQYHFTYVGAQIVAQNAGLCDSAIDCNNPDCGIT